MNSHRISQDIEPFQIGSRQQAENFADFVSRYGSATFQPYNISDEIRNIFEYARFHSNDNRVNGKLLNAYIDLEQTYLFMLKDSIYVQGISNRLQKDGKNGLRIGVR
ncbi:MAG: hypothetical protein F4X97_06535 [Boseongicola sp. SB0662_bin_57]|nr:hypothetical protein [Boseongicola sp. SB0662_bin_57]